MRAAIVITLIVVGGLLVVAPLVADYQMKTNHQANVVRLLEKPDAQRVNLIKDETSTGLSAACILLGAVLAGTGLFLAIRDSRSPAPPP